MGFQALMPRVSVVLPVHNGMDFVRDAISSVLDQSFSDLELIVVDDHSTDGTATLLNSFSDPRLRIVANRQRGLVSALNMGIDEARGDVVARMDADDICARDRLGLQLELLDKTNADVVYSDAFVFHRSVNEPRMRVAKGPCPAKLHAILTRMDSGPPLIHPTVMMKRRILESCGGYRDYPSAEDRDLWLRLIPDAKFSHIAKPLLYYRINPGGVSQRRRLEQATSGVVAVVVDEVRRSHKVDVYSDLPSILGEIRAQVHVEMESVVAALALRASLRELSAGRFEDLAAAFRLLWPSMWWVFSRKRRLQRERAIIDKFSDIVRAAVNMDRAVRQPHVSGLTALSSLG